MEIESDDLQFVVCPHCGEEVQVSGEADEELDGGRIHRIAQLKRSGTRAKAYGRIGAVACLGISALLVYLGVRQWRGLAASIAYFAGAVLMAGLTVRLWLKFR